MHMGMAANIICYKHYKAANVISDKHHMVKNIIECTKATNVAFIIKYSNVIKCHHFDVHDMYTYEYKLYRYLFLMCITV